LILRERSDRRIFSAEIEPRSGKILRFAQDDRRGRDDRGRMTENQQDDDHQEHP